MKIKYCLKKYQKLHLGRNKIRMNTIEDIIEWIKNYDNLKNIYRNLYMSLDKCLSIVTALAYFVLVEVRDVILENSIFMLLEL